MFIGKDVRLRTGEEITVVFRTWGTFSTCPARFFNVPGTIFQRARHDGIVPHPFLSQSQAYERKKETQKIPPTERRGYVSYRPAPDALIILMIKSSNRITDGD